MSKYPTEPRSNEITPENLYLRRREFIKNAAFTAGTALAAGAGLMWLVGQGPPPEQPAPPDLVPPEVVSATGAFDVDEKWSTYQEITTYNNFYELGLGKSDPARNAGSLRPRPWTVEIEGEVAKPQTIDIDTLMSWFPLEQRVYRMRCVEAWSMVIPWLGFPLAELVKRLEPTGKARYVEFITLHDVEQLPGQRWPVLDWPYVEGLRLDEAMNPLAFIATGLYGKELPGQNGAPLRLVTPWKYGFKGGKSIVKIRFTEQQPQNTWAVSAPSEYGFYANVNPAVDHPRWSQATERRIGEFQRRDTLPFNGYAEYVEHLYSGMNLRLHF